MNQTFLEISDLFSNSGISNFEKLPESKSEKGKFASLFRIFNEILDAAKVQGFVWNQLIYTFSHGKGIRQTKVDLAIDEKIYLTLVLRYKELVSGGRGGTTDEDVPYYIAGYITEIDTGKIDNDYMNSRFSKYLKSISTDEADKALDELYKTFATLSQEEQKYANIFLHDIQSGAINVDGNKTLRDYINEYQSKGYDDMTHRLSIALGLDEQKLRSLMALNVTEGSLNEYGRYDELRKSVDKLQAKKFFEKRLGSEMKQNQVNMRVDELLRKFIFEGGFEL
jgi:type I restriction enzyme R subunit